MSGKNKTEDKLAALTAMRKAAVADTPPVMTPATPPERTPPARPAPGPAASTTAAGGLREKTSITLTPAAATALRRLQSFLMLECEAGTVPAAVVVNLALELTAKSLPESRGELLKLLGDHRQADKRRRKSA